MKGRAGESVILAARRVLTADGLAPGWVRLVDDRIVEVGRSAAPPGAVALGDVVLAPGFVDLHQLAGGGAAYTDGPAAARVARATHLRHGTTTVVASLVTDELSTVERQVAELAPLVHRGDLAGLHLEGPWLSERHHGAHDAALLRDPLWTEVDRVLAAGAGTVVMVTLAPERAGSLDTIARLADRGLLPALGHSHATYAETNRAVDAGARVATHLFNAARPIHQREPGITVALLQRPEVVVELIADGVHVHPALLRQAMSAGDFVLVTDAMAATGAADGDYELGPLQVRVTEGVARLVDGGAIAGSTLTLDAAVRYAVEAVGIDLATALHAASTRPAELLGRPDLGRIAAGARADLVVLDQDLLVREVWCGGVRLDPHRGQ